MSTSAQVCAGDRHDRELGAVDLTTSGSGWLRTATAQPCCGLITLIDAGEDTQTEQWRASANEIKAILADVASRVFTVVKLAPA